MWDDRDRDAVLTHIAERAQVIRRHRQRFQLAAVSACVLVLAATGVFGARAATSGHRHGVGLSTGGAPDVPVTTQSGVQPSPVTASPAEGHLPTTTATATPVPMRTLTAIPTAGYPSNMSNLPVCPTTVDAGGDLPPTPLPWQPGAKVCRPAQLQPATPSPTSTIPVFRAPPQG